MAYQSKANPATTGYQSSSKIQESNEKKANRDPITGEPGSHPIATGVGAAVGSAAGVVAAIASGALTGSVMGPAGAIVGAVAGGILGGGIGHAAGEDAYPTQIAWWEENYSSRPYVKKGSGFDSYKPAYWYGTDAAAKNKGASFSEIEPKLASNWDTHRSTSDLDWNSAKPATQDAYERMLKDQKF